MNFFGSRSSSCSDLSSYKGECMEDYNDCNFESCEPQPCAPPPMKCTTVCEPKFKTIQQKQTCYKTVSCPKQVKTRRVVRVPKEIKGYKVRLINVQVPTTRKIWQCENVVENKTVRKVVKEPFCKTVMVPKVVTGYKFETRCKKVPVCEPAPVCPPMPCPGPKPACPEPVYSNDDCNYSCEEQDFNCDPCGKPSLMDKIKYVLRIQ